MYQTYESNYEIIMNKRLLNMGWVENTRIVQK